ncbi:hypothetical protein PHJA_002882000 [Phtheirospermum japonicum]|uniref:RING-type E3 ubiquitin transferase n=1 Tax=Phtheirospermum japonicum TaxID=374723 RepID=A0A830DCD7_9LAMI|nr:hypothetical protein PHJA_002882000 [Phtheirospermum japonicum]
MGSKAGYQYRHRFSLVDETQINSSFKSTLYDGAKTFVYEFRTTFILKKRPEEEESHDAERFDACVPENSNGHDLYWRGGNRLDEYWMTRDESLSLANEAFAFAKQMVDNDPQLGSPVPVVVDLDVCTVQREGETFDACMDRAITAQKLVPLYLWYPAQTVEHKPSTMCGGTVFFLRDLGRMRVEHLQEGLALMPVCPICSRGTNIGAQISLLPCQHAFHSHCIVRLLESNKLTCPLCHSPVDVYISDHGTFSNVTI